MRHEFFYVILKCLLLGVGSCRTGDWALSHQSWTSDCICPRYPRYLHWQPGTSLHVAETNCRRTHLGGIRWIPVKIWFGILGGDILRCLALNFRNSVFLRVWTAKLGRSQLIELSISSNHRGPISLSGFALFLHLYEFVAISALRRLAPPLRNSVFPFLAPTELTAWNSSWSRSSTEGKPEGGWGLVGDGSDCEAQWAITKSKSETTQKTSQLPLVR